MANTTRNRAWPRSCPPDQARVGHQHQGNRQILLVDYSDIKNLKTTPSSPPSSCMTAAGTPKRYFLVAPTPPNKIAAVVDTKTGKLAALVDTKKIPHPGRGANFHPSSARSGPRATWAPTW